MNAPSARLGDREVGLDGDVELRRRAALAHLVHGGAGALVTGSDVVPASLMPSARVETRSVISRSGTLIVIGARPRI